jgi:hypothetical protein
MASVKINMTIGILSFLLTAAVLSSGLAPTHSVYAEDDNNNGYGDTEQKLKQKQNCKIGVFSDPEDEVSYTVSGNYCNQHSQNSIDGQ